ncbi:cation diffusion facilitator family transporter [Amorphus orientalis]|uniref:Cobalt-zinc-cadmium efflux system protein n=1 Tax=Amorphus orientalis TaxID=649198 RepID=A0AAE3VM61_9HYPH|nr:cation diffusion facilitator family transporter [Amorphus orientalis]MDQ0314510.1 cobalt-zinc-cadmium efflux system protein [Amorphus orientalis]
MAHSHGGGHEHGHSHGHASDNERATAIAAFLTGGFMIAEAAGGIIANSLTLLADAAHMLTDCVALGLAWWAFRQSRKPATPELTFGRHRMPVLIAFANGIVLLLLTAWIVVEAIDRLFDPQPVSSIPLLVVAWLGLLVNIAAFLVLSGGNKGSLNIRAAVLHVISDLLGSVAAIIAGGVILFTGFMAIDPILSMVVSALILRTTIRLLRESSHILLEGAPSGIEPEAIAEDLTAMVPGVEKVHHVHIWSLSEERSLVTLHAVVDQETDIAMATAGIRARLADRFGVGHATVELETPGRETVAEVEPCPTEPDRHGH